MPNIGILLSEECQNTNLFQAHHCRFLSTVIAGLSGKVKISCANKVSVGLRDSSCQENSHGMKYL